MTEAESTKSTRIYREMRRDITSGVYAPGQNLVRRAMPGKYAVSLSIINEVLSRLMHDSLIERGERQAARVIQLSDEEKRKHLHFDEESKKEEA